MSAPPPTPVTAPATTGGADVPERTLGQLVADASRDLSAIVRSEVALAKAEVKAEVKTAGLGAAMFGAAALFGLVALVMLLIAAAFGLVALGLAGWAAFLVVAVVLLVLAGLLALVGKSRLSKVTGPERTVRTTKETIATLKAAGPHST